MDQINADPKGNWYELARKNTDQQIVPWSEFKSTTGLWEDKKRKHSKRS
jgi:hypothetical protein